jgi:ABC-2 type transport system ATP-binding protein
MSLLEVNGLIRDYGSLRAVDEVSFTLKEGVILGFIGPNGAGKSTTMRILATLDVPTRGKVLIDGKDAVERPDEARPLIGYMPDRYGTYDDMTVFEFLDFFARAYRLKGAERAARVESVMEFARLTELRDKLTSALSKGMRQRVALGRTLLHDPKLLILDEPADGLDPRARIELRELLKALADQGKAVLISSHILTELSEICDECAIIEQGKLLATGGVAEILSRTGGASTDVLVRLAGASDEVMRKAERLFLEQPGVTSVAVEGASALRLRVDQPQGGPAGWEDAACSALLRAAVQAQLPVCSLSRKEVDLEDAFMTVTRGRVQ